MISDIFPALIISLWLLLAGAVAYIFWRLRRLEREESSLTSLYLDQQQQQISMLQRDLAGLLKKIEQQARQSVQPDLELSPYKQAIEMIRQGLSADEVASRCGISRSEAELIISLYRNSSTS